MIFEWLALVPVARASLEWDEYLKILILRCGGIVVVNFSISSASRSYVDHGGRTSTKNRIVLSCSVDGRRIASVPGYRWSDLTFHGRQDSIIRIESEHIVREMFEWI